MSVPETMSGEHELTRDTDVDLGGIFATLWRRKGTILLVGLLATALAWLVLTAIKPRYNAQVSVLIQDSDTVLTRNRDTNQNAQAGPAIDEQGVASQVELLQSNTIARTVIDKLGLKDNPEFDFASNPSLSERLLAIIGLGNGGSNVAPTDRLLETYYERLKVYQVNRARLIGVEFWAHDAELAASIANAISEEYVGFQEELKRGVDTSGLEKLQPELEKQKEKVLAAEAKVAAYKAQTGLLAGKGKPSLAEQDLTELSTELSNVRSQLSQAQAKAQSVQRAVQSGSLESAESVLQSPIIQKLLENQAGFNSLLAQQNTKLLPGHPSIIATRSQIATVERELETEMKKIQSSLQAEVRIAEDRVKDLVAKRNTMKSEVAREEEQAVQLRALERDAEAEAELLNGFLVRFKEATSRQSRDFLPADAKIVSKAYPSTRSYFPKKLPILAGTFFGSMLLTAMMLLAAGILGGVPQPAAPKSKEGPKTPANAKPEKTAAPVSLALPWAPQKKQANEKMHENLLNRLAEEEKIGKEKAGLSTLIGKAAGLMKRKPKVDEPVNVEAEIAASLPNDEPLEDKPVAEATDPLEPNAPSSMMVVAKSLTMLDQARVAIVTPEGEETACGAIALARLLSSIAPTVVVDMAGEATTTINMLGTTKVAGVKDILASEVSFAQAIHVDRVSNAHIIPTGDPDVEIKVDGGVVLPVFLEALQQTYNYVIIDAGDASAKSIKRLQYPNMGIVVNAVNPQSLAVIAAMEEFYDSDLAEPVLMEMTPEAGNAVGVSVKTRQS